MPKKRKFDANAKAHLLRLSDKLILESRTFMMESSHYFLQDDAILLAIAEQSARAAAIRPQIESRELKTD